MIAEEISYVKNKLDSLRYQAPSRERNKEMHEWEQRLLWKLNQARFEASKIDDKREPLTMAPLFPRYARTTLPMRSQHARKALNGLFS